MPSNCSYFEPETRNNAVKGNSLFIYWKAMVIEEAGVTVERANECAAEKLSRAYDMGEEVWIAAATLKLIAAAPKRQKTLKELAVSYTVVGRK